MRVRCSRCKSRDIALLLPASATQLDDEKLLVPTAETVKVQSAPREERLSRERIDGSSGANEAMKLRALREKLQSRAFTPSPAGVGEIRLCRRCGEPLIGSVSSRGRWGCSRCNSYDG